MELGQAQIDMTEAAHMGEIDGIYYSRYINTFGTLLPTILADFSGHH